ncbi:DUF4332 domain-containing protein [Arhodomonas sp. AD133]|uniref:DUF4332 domain-containing protein n=1 Tax=Arhodomonas sp. AD133 TaxID=3415009 RepID=UPI003EBDE014
MWAEMFKRWVDMLFWWLPREDTPRSESQSARPASAPPRPPTEADAQRLDPERVVRRDDLTVIKGIGETMQERLQNLGVHSFEDLATADPDRLTHELKARQIVISRERVDGWIEAARERC